jgi:hypothetical protein
VVPLSRDLGCRLTSLYAVHDMHGISESYGTRMLFVLLLFVIETSATIGSVWESIGERFDKSGSPFDDDDFRGKFLFAGAYIFLVCTYCDPMSPSYCTKTKHVGRCCS